MRAYALLAIALIGCASGPSAEEGRTDDAPAASSAEAVVDADVAVADSSDRAPLLGLLRLPEVFGAGPCDRATPTSVTLYAQPARDDAIGRIEVATPWTHHPEGGCSGLAVVSRVRGLERPLPTNEVGYEEPAALVVARSGDAWFRVRLDDTSAAWVEATEPSRFTSLAALLVDGLAYLTDAWDGRLAAEPGAAPREAAADAATTQRSVRVVETRVVEGRQWGRVEVLDASPCAGDDVRVVDTGWLPLHASSGASTVWFHARGC